MSEFWVLTGFVVVNLIGAGFFFGSLYQQIKDLKNNLKATSNHLSEIQNTLTDIRVRTMNLHSRLTTIERNVKENR